ncbi:MULTISPECIES: hypothetical protein [Streptomyces]|uniref:hypothetical protein n=1 Tax=Streptomyces TaxID=1883 RepID=UPI001C5A164D|nr:hypothetical protein [Streptomyces sp. 09ZI22]MBW3359452.1 hypothetical protein [Streptomyces sp. 09ZI22]
MARKQADPTARRAREAARRTAAAQRIGPRPPRTPRPRQPKLLSDLNPPGTYYTDWDSPVGSDTEVMAKVTNHFGADSDEATTMRYLLHFRKIYGPGELGGDGWPLVDDAPRRRGRSRRCSPAALGDHPEQVVGEGPTSSVASRVRPECDTATHVSC